MLVKKTNRLYRNLKDWVTVDELDVEIHFPKEGVVLSRESRSSEKFMHGKSVPVFPPTSRLTRKKVASATYGLKRLLTFPRGALRGRGRTS